MMPLLVLMVAEVCLKRYDSETIADPHIVEASTEEL